MLVLLFLPFSALDKVLAFRSAVAQARETFASPLLATLAIVVGLCIEVVLSAAVLSGVVDRLAAFVLAGYCIVTALLWKRFWSPGDFRITGPSRARDLFWDFWKNVAVAGGFLSIAFGPTVVTAAEFIAHPFASSQPYASAPRNLP